MNVSPLTQETDDLDSIMEQLDLCSDRLPIDAIQAARRNKAKIIPRLIESIRVAIDMVRNREIDELNKTQVHLLALYLLFEFRASEALPVILEGIKLRAEAAHELFGDAITETLPRVLAVLGGDRALEISVELFRDTKLDKYVRWSAVQVPVILAATNARSRVEMVALCRQLLREALDNKDREGVSCIVGEMLELNPWEAKDEIKEAFDRNMVDLFAKDWDSARKNLKDRPFKIVDPRLTNPYLDDCVKELQSWGCFKRDDDLEEDLDDNGSAEAELSEEIESILDTLDQCGHKLPVEAIQAARLHKAAIIPKLIEKIRQATDSLRDGDNNEGQAAFLAFFLLLEFRATEALPAILDAFSLPDDGPLKLFGDAIHEHLARVLIVLGQDQCAEISAELFRNTKLNLYVRWSAIKVPILLVATGLRPRDEMMSLCRQLLREAKEQKDREIVSAAIAEMLDLNPWEAADDIRDAFDNRLVDESIVDRGDVEPYLVDKPMENKNGFLTRIYLEDVVAELSHWASFQERPKPHTSAPSPLLIPAPQPIERASPPSEPVAFAPSVAVRNDAVRIGRNDPCPCGSGQKYKRCCGGHKG